jgi:hypothetical protein
VVDAESDSLPEGFSYSAPTMLVLFVFINAMAGGAAMIQSRTPGIYDRMLAGPVTARAIVQARHHISRPDAAAVVHRRSRCPVRGRTGAT